MDHITVFCFKLELTFQWFDVFYRSKSKFSETNYTRYILNLKYLIRIKIFIFVNITVRRKASYYDSTLRHNLNYQLLHIN